MQNPQHVGSLGKVCLAQLMGYLGQLQGVINLQRLSYQQYLLTACLCLLRRRQQAKPHASGRVQRPPSIGVTKLPTERLWQLATKPSCANSFRRKNIVKDQRAGTCAGLWRPSAAEQMNSGPNDIAGLVIQGRQVLGPDGDKRV